VNRRPRGALSFSAALLIGLVVQVVLLTALVAGELTRALLLSLGAVFGLAWNSVMVVQTILEGYVRGLPTRSDGGHDARGPR
jgi:hypothetical protein